MKGYFRAPLFRSIEVFSFSCCGSRAGVGVSGSVPGRLSCFLRGTSTANAALVDSRATVFMVAAAGLVAMMIFSGFRTLFS